MGDEELNREYLLEKLAQINMQDKFGIFEKYWQAHFKLPHEVFKKHFKDLGPSWFVNNTHNNDTGSSTKQTNLQTNPRTNPRRIRYGPS